MDVVSFWQPLAGGALIGVAAALILWLNGRLFGVSGLIGGLLAPVRGDVAWRALALLGLLIAGALGVLLAPDHFGHSPRSLASLTGAGLCVGIGTRLANGCTSGHGVCGVGRLSPRSLVATATFVATGVLTVLVLRVLGGAS